MAVTRVRVHQSGEATTSGTTIAAETTAAVTIGNLLVAAVTCRTGAATVSSLSKPGGETATWAKVASHALGTDVGAELWVIQTTVVWPEDTFVTATFGVAAQRRAIILTEFSGVDDVTRAPAVSATSTTGGAAATVPAGTTTVDALAVGDLALGLASLKADNFYDSITPDTDTAAGTWVEDERTGNRTTFGDTGGLGMSLQHKAITAAGAQTFDVSYANSGSGIGGVGGPRSVGASLVVLRTTNVAPNAPTLSWPIAAAVVNRGAVNRLRWVFSDPNPSDIQSRADVRWRIVSTTDWTNATVNTWYGFYDVAPLTFEAGDYEWQARTYDALGYVGPWTSSAFFTADDPPDGPSITYPIAGQDLDQFEYVAWTISSQEAWRVRRVADASGAPDESTIYWDSGEQVDTVARAAQLVFEVNGRPEWVQVQIKDGGLWSDWVSVNGEVSYSPPPVPVVEMEPDPATGSLLVKITNPAPAPGDPAAVWNDVYVDDGNGEERRAEAVAVNSDWRYWTPRSGRDYRYAIRVVGVAANGTTSSS